MRAVVMRAVVIRAHGGLDQLRLEERPVPEPGPREVRVRVRAVALNHLDVWLRRGVPGHAFPLPLVPGSEGAGVVDAVGPGVTHVRPGDEVLVLPDSSCGVCAQCQAGQQNLCRGYHILGESRDGCCAEHVVVPDAGVVPRPLPLDMVHAAAAPLSFLTAWSMLRKAGLQVGETMLVQAGGSGVGSAAVQIGKLLGAVVIATAGGPEKAAQVASLGADHVIDYRAQEFAAEVRRLTAKRGADVVVEHVGAATWEGSMRSLARGGRLVTCGATTGAEVQVNLRALFFKNLALIGSTMGTRADMMAVLRLLEQRKLRPVVGRVLPLAEVGEAHRLLEARELFGKVVLEV